MARCARKGRPWLNWPQVKLRPHALALIIMASGCAEIDQLGQRDNTIALKTPLASPAASGDAALQNNFPGAAIRAAEQRAIKGFIKRATPPSLKTDSQNAIAQSRGAPAGEPAEITLDFDRADLVSVVRVMMEDGLGANYLIDPRVSGSVTLRTNRPLQRSEVLPTLEEILRLNNAAVIERDGLFRVTPREEAGLSAPLLTAADAEARGLTVRVTPLRYVSVSEVAEVLDSFAPVAGSIRYDRSRNLVFTTGSAAEQATILEAISALDVDYFAGRSFALRPLQEASPEQVVDELNAMFAPPSGGQSPAIRFLAVQRMNAVLAIADEEPLLDEALGLIRDLDQGFGDSARLRVFPVVNRRATELAQVLGDIFDVDVASGATQLAEPQETINGRAGALAPDLQARTDGAETRPSGAQRLGGVTSVPQARQDSIRGEVSAGLGVRGGVVHITADEASNSIVALATGDGARALENALRRLDVRPLQVMIEATLVEVSLNDTLEFGLRWAIDTGNFSFSFSELENGVIPDATAPLQGFNAAFRTPDINATLSALDAATEIRILSSPTLMVLDNQTARLQVGDQVPVTVRSSSSTTTDDSRIVTEEEFRDTGVILEIRPSVNAGGNVVLAVRQEVSSVAPSSGSDNPTISQRAVESTISVQSGETIALAGLIQEQEDQSRDGVPVVSKLPVIGSLFGANRDVSARSELVVMIRPIVIRDQADARAATSELQRKLINLAPRPTPQGQPAQADAQ